MAARRPWLAAVLAVLYPGLGHVYLREWLRALLWFLLALSTAMLVVPDSAVQGGGLEAILDAQATLPPAAMAALVAVTLFSVVDAYWLATRGETPSAGGRDGSEDPADEGSVRCPNCRRSVDGEEYGFCPWCAAELEAPASTTHEDGEGGGAGANP